MRIGSIRMVTVHSGLPRSSSQFLRFLDPPGAGFSNVATSLGVGWVGELLHWRLRWTHRAGRTVFRRGFGGERST